MGISGIGRDQSFFRAIAHLLSGAGSRFTDKAVASTPLMPASKKEKRRNIGGHLNQRQIRKRAAQGCKVRQECRLKQRGRR